VGGGAAGASGNGGGVSPDVACNSARRLLGDFDGDGIGDCVVPDNQALAFHKGIGGGLVQEASVLSSGPCLPPTRAGVEAVADMDADGRDDILYSWAVTTAQYSLYLATGRADGTFLCPSNPMGALDGMFPPTGMFSSTRSVYAVGDFTSDGRDDVFLIVTSVPLSNEVSWTVINLPGGGTKLNASTTMPGFILGALGWVDSLSAANVDSDGHLDVRGMVTIRGMGGTAIPQEMTAYGNGDGTFRCGVGDTMACPNPESYTGAHTCEAGGTFGRCECKPPQCVLP
jgi:hypothetical protein